MARRGDEVEAEALAVVDGAHQPRDLDLAAIAGARVHLADAESAAEEPSGAQVDFANEVNDVWITGRKRLGDYARAEDLGEEAHLLWPTPPRLGHDSPHYNRISLLSRRYSRAGDRAGEAQRPARGPARSRRPRACSRARGRRGRGRAAGGDPPSCR